MSTRTPFVPNADTRDIVRGAADDVRRVSGATIGDLVEAALLRTLTDTVGFDDAGRAFIITGDIPAMWLRDSTTQLTPYLRYLDRSTQLADLVEAVIRRQFGFIAHDSYANAFNDGPTGAHYDPEDVCDDPNVWEQKYEIDSLCYPVTLAHALWRRTGRTTFIDAGMHDVLRTIVAQLRLEQDHERSPYRFERSTTIPTETLAREGRGTEVARTGMTWGGFRPSDDACTYGYNIPANLFACQALRAIAEIARELLDDSLLSDDAERLAQEISAGVRAHGIVAGPGDAPIYAYEVDGRGGVLVMDDANTPSLLALPLVAPDVMDRRIWEATRAVILGPANPYWYSGSLLSGIGSPHTLPRRVWPIALAVQGLTGTAEERVRLLELIAATADDAGHIHEGVDVDDPSQFSRPWFSWADSMFCELALQVAEDARTS